MKLRQAIHFILPLLILVSCNSREKLVNEKIHNLEKAGESGRWKIQSFLKTLGYVTVFVE